MWSEKAVHVDLGERGKGWHYAQLWKTGGGPIGFCSEHPPHETEEEARQCYAAYQRQQLRVVEFGDWTGCQHEDCDKPTKSGWGIGGGGQVVALCHLHETRGHAIPLLHLDKPAGDSFGS